MSEDEYVEEDVEEGADDGEDEGYAPGGYVYQPNDSLLSALGRQWGAAPWYVSSAFIHMVILGLMLLFAPEPKAPKPPQVQVKGEIVEEILETPEIVEKKEEEVKEETKEEVKVEVNQEVKLTEVVVETVVTVDDSSDTTEDNTAFMGDGESDGEAAVMGLSGSRSSGAKSTGKFATRSKEGQKKKNRAAGMSKSSQDALEAGLVWLAKTQDTQGYWDCQRYEGKASNISVTALAQLAFLGAGNSAKVGTYRKNVRASQAFLLSKLDPKSGRIGMYRYEAAITMMAMAEAWAMSEDKKLAEVVQGQVNDAMKYQDVGGGWGYTPDADAAKAHVDTSVAGWWMMGMKSAKVAGAEISDQSWQRAQTYFKGVTQKGSDGVVTSGYVGKGAAPNMTAVGLTCLQFLGLPREDPLVKGQAEYFMKHPEHMISPRSNLGNPYYGWYYQALGLFQMGTKSEYWKKFGPVMQSVMTQIQEKSGSDKGSWPPKLAWQKDATHFEEQVGRVGTTAIGCLILEVCFRYDDAHAAH